MLQQLERQEVEEQQIEPRVVAPPAFPVEDDQRQRRRMVIALILLLVALGLVLVKDRDFWFPSTDTTAAESEPTDDSTPLATVEAARTATPASSPGARALGRSLSTAKRKQHSAASKAPETAVPTTPMVTATRAVLPPLRVEVVAGDQHLLVKPGSPSVKVDLQPGAVVPPISETARAQAEMASVGTAPLTNAGERVQMSTDTRQALSRPVRPEYPLLARQMKVEGAVVLQALIGRDGGIQNLHVLGGPTILAEAAREAVKQWRFKPYFQDGQAVETQAQVTVNFKIQTN